VKTTVFLTDMAEFAAMNDAYVAAFGGNRPARSAFAVAGLPLGALVEIEAWAYTSRSPSTPPADHLPAAPRARPRDRGSARNRRRWLQLLNDDDDDNDDDDLPPLPRRSTPM